MMRTAILSLIILLATPAHALNEGLQCVPYARALTGVDIRGDAHSWWAQAAGRYDRGVRPRVGAVMAFIPYGNMRLGHVAAVRRIVDQRTLLISHANWSTIGGVRGHIEEDVRVVDVSADNDWSRVRVWYTPNRALGTTEWPVQGFIYPQKPRTAREAQTALATVLTKPPSSLSLASLKQRADEKTSVRRPAFTLSNSLFRKIDKKAIAETWRR